MYIGVVRMLYEKYMHEDLPGLDTMVRRDHVLSDAFKRMARPSFSPHEKLNIVPSSVWT